MNIGDAEAEHYNPLLVTVLPKERRARHAYQVATMVLLIALGVYQLALGPNPVSSVNDLTWQAQSMLNWLCIVGGSAGLAAAFIPERIVRWTWGRILFDFDATYWRLFDELGCHLLLLSVWSSYCITFITVNGWGFGPIAGVCFGGAALTRAVQISLTLYRAGVFSRKASAIVGVDTLNGGRDAQ